MAVFAWPNSLRPSEMTWRLVDNTQFFSSPLTGSIETNELPVYFWETTLFFDEMLDDEIAELEAFVARLRGKTHRAALWNFRREDLRGTATGAGAVNGANQVASGLVTDGWNTSQAQLFHYGDMVGVGGELKRMIDIISSDPAGNATLIMEPPFRNPPADNSLIDIDRPTANFMLVSAPDFSYARSLGSTTLQLIEDITG